MFTFRKGHKKLDLSATRPDADTRDERDERDEIEVILDSVEGEVERVVEDAGPPQQRVSVRDVYEGRAKSDSFYDAETELIPASLVTSMTPPSSLSPFMVSPPPEAPLPPEPANAPPTPIREPARASSAPWLMVLFAAACTAGFFAFLERPAARHAAAIAPPPAATLPVADASVGSETDASTLNESADAAKAPSTRDE